MLRWGGRNSVHVVLMLLTPRGGAYWAHPEEGLASFWPNRYTDAINAVNDGLRVRAAPRPDPGPGSITISCMRWHRAHGPVRKRSLLARPLPPRHRCQHPPQHVLDLALLHPSLHHRLPHTRTPSNARSLRPSNQRPKLGPSRVTCALRRRLRRRTPL